LGVSGVVSNFVRNHLSVWEGFFSGKGKEKNAGLIPHATLWNVWPERYWSFSDAVETPLQHIKTWSRNLFFVFGGIVRAFANLHLMYILWMSSYLDVQIPFGRYLLCIQPFVHNLLV